MNKITKFQHKTRTNVTIYKQSHVNMYIYNYNKNPTNMKYVACEIKLSKQKKVCAYNYLLKYLVIGTINLYKCRCTHMTRGTRESMNCFSNR